MPFPTRRDLLTVSLGLIPSRGVGRIALAALASMSSSLTEGKERKEPPNVEKWMQTWMEGERLRKPEGTLHVSRFREPMYFLTKPIAWTPNVDQVGRYDRVDVPAGFVTDFASIPRVFWSILRPDGEYTYPAIIHDYMYWDQSRPREMADEIFKLGMQDFELSKTIIFTIYEAVRTGGGAAWRSNAKRKAAGEKRVLAKTPEDPRVRWVDWKKRADVFAN